MAKKFNIAIGTDMGGIKNVSHDWSEVVSLLTAHTITAEKSNKYFVAGHFTGESRKEANLLGRSLLTLDIDNYEGELADLHLDVEIALDGLAFAAYSTHSHKPAAPRIRIAIPLIREVSAQQYRQLSRRFVSELDIELPIDTCSYVPNQCMFLPNAPKKEWCWSYVQKGKALQVDDYLKSVVETDTGSGELVLIDDDDDGDFTKDIPLELSDIEVDSYINALDNTDLDYEAWMRVGAAIHHQTRGSKKGFLKWVDWSKKSEKHDGSQMKTKWRSFGRSVKVVKFSTIIWMVKEAGGMPESSITQLITEASAIEDMSAYQAFRDKILTIDEIILPPDVRAVVASRVYDHFGRHNGMPRADIKKAMTPKRKSGAAMLLATQHGMSTKDRSFGRGLPKWLADWVYVQTQSKFANWRDGYSIAADAFNATYSRESACIKAELSASQYATIAACIPVVVDTVWWPNADRMVKHEGKMLLNEYHDNGITPCDPDELYSEEGERVVGLLLQHTEMLLTRQPDREILLDWIAWVVQNPGKKIRWAVLLQGGEGCGKTYYAELMQNMLGSSVRKLDTSAVSGRFTSWGYGALVNVIEELRVAGSNRFEVVDRLKPFITNPVVQIEEKGRDHRDIPNFTSYMGLTNHKDAIPLSDSDRRWWVIFARIQSEAALFNYLGGREAAEAYFTELFDTTELRADVLKRFFLDRKISPSFNPNGRAPVSPDKDEMRNLMTSPERMLIEELLDQHACSVVSDSLVDITYLNDQTVLEGRELPKTRALSAILSELGYQPISKKRVRVKETKRYHYIWFKPTSRAFEDDGEDGALAVVRNHFANGGDGDDLDDDESWMDC